MTDFITEKSNGAPKDNIKEKEVEMNVLKAVWMAEDFGEQAQESAFVTRKSESLSNFGSPTANLSEASSGTSPTVELEKKKVDPLHHRVEILSGQETTERHSSVLAPRTKGRGSIRNETVTMPTNREEIEKLRFSGSLGGTGSPTLIENGTDVMKRSFEVDSDFMIQPSRQEAPPPLNKKSASHGISDAWRAQSESSGLKTSSDEIPIVLKKSKTDGKASLKSFNSKLPSHIAIKNRKTLASRRVADKTPDGVLSPASAADFLTLEKRAQPDVLKSPGISLRTRDSVKRTRFEEKIKEASRVSPSKALLEQLNRHKEIRNMSESDRKVIENIFLLRMAARHLLRLSLLTENPKVITNMFRALKKRMT